MTNYLDEFAKRECKFCKSKNLSSFIGGNWVDHSTVTTSKRYYEKEDDKPYYPKFKKFDVMLCSDCGRMTEFNKIE